MFKHNEMTDIILKSFYEVDNAPGDGFLESIIPKNMYVIIKEKYP